LWYFSVFAGGDAKLIAGIAFCIPIQDYSILFANTSNPYFLPLIFILAVFLVFPLGFFLALKRVILNKYYKTMFAELLKNTPKYIEVAFTLVGLYFIFSLLGVPTIFALLSFLLWKITWKIRMPIALIVFVVAIWLQPTNILNFFVYILISVIFFIIVKLFWFVRSKEFANFKKISDLKEGDILYESLHVKDNKMAKKPGLKDIFKYLKNKDILQKNLNLMKDSSYDYVIKSRPGGLLVDEIKLLKSLKAKKIIPGGIYIKQSVPLTPAILGSYIILLFLGGLI
jgi:Flp pilus assembly protein protease CpaA